MGIERVLERKVNLDVGGELTHNDEAFELGYYLIESNITWDELEDRKAYGIEIVKFKNNVELEKHSVRDLSSRKEEAVNVLHKLANNIVTPIEVQYILQDMIGV